MQKLHYHHVDVFTQQRFGGNQLAVFLDPPPAISTELMQSIAREMNFSESTFVFPPRDNRSDFRVRIFTPGKELPMAGHPTVGTAFVLQHTGRIPAQGTVRFEEGVGIISVALADGGSGVTATMEQPAPQFGGVVADRETLARSLSLDPSQIRSDVPAEIISCGVPYIYAPVQNLDAVKTAHPRTDILETLREACGVGEVFVFTTETERSEATVHGRMFAPFFGITEDPATGSAAGPLGIYLVRNGLAKPGAYICEQGFEMGRPSLINIEIKREGETYTRIAVGGHSVYIGEGYVLVD